MSAHTGLPAAACRGVDGFSTRSNVQIRRWLPIVATNRSGARGLPDSNSDAASTSATGLKPVTTASEGHGQPRVGPTCLLNFCKSTHRARWIGTVEMWHGRRAHTDDTLRNGVNT